MSGSTYLSGLAAEDIAERLYVSNGYEIRERRWRSEAGEIDLIFGADGLVVFVEVKARKDHDRAAAAISQAQWARIMLSAEIYVGQANLPATIDLRFDAALIDQTGVCKVIENAPVF